MTIEEAKKVPISYCYLYRLKDNAIRTAGILEKNRALHPLGIVEVRGLSDYQYIVYAMFPDVSVEIDTKAKERT